MRLTLVIFFLAADVDSWTACPGNKYPLKIPPGYDRTVPHRANNVTVVHFVFGLVKILEVDEDRSIMALHVYMRISWNDSRLERPASCAGEVEPSLAAAIWRPDPYLFHAAHISRLPAFVGEAEAVEGRPTGITWWMELVVEIHCAFDFTMYPFDRQECGMLVASKTSTTSTLVFETVEVRDMSQGLQQKMNFRYWLEELNRREDRVWMNPENGTEYSVTGFRVLLKRHVGPMIANVFTPSFLTVVMSSIREKNEISSG